MIISGYRERQDAQVAKQAREQIEYCNQAWYGLTDWQINDLTRDKFLNMMADIGQGEIMARKPAKATQALELMEALTFVEEATKDRGQKTFEFVNLANKQAVCFDGVLAAGMEIKEELSLAPKLAVFKAALAKSGKSLTLTELPAGRLSVKGEKITVQVPCVPTVSLPAVQPDPLIAPINDELKTAFEALEGILSETGDRIIETSLLLEANTATATNGKVLMQYWHGNDLPPNLILPRAFIQAVSRQMKSLIGFGYTPNSSVTFWFEDKSWYKTQLYQDAYPSINGLIDVQSSPIESPIGLWEGCAQVAEFDEDGYIAFKENALIAGVAKYPVEGIQEGLLFNYNYIKKVIPYIETIDLTSYPDRAFFFGDKIRGVMIKAVRANVGMEE